LREGGSSGGGSHEGGLSCGGGSRGGGSHSRGGGHSRCFLHGDNSLLCRGENDEVLRIGEKDERVNEMEQRK